MHPTKSAYVKIEKWTSVSPCLTWKPLLEGDSDEMDMVVINAITSALGAASTPDEERAAGEQAAAFIATNPTYASDLNSTLAGRGLEVFVASEGASLQRGLGL